MQASFTKLCSKVLENPDSPPRARHWCLPWVAILKQKSFCSHSPWNDILNGLQYPCHVCCLEMSMHQGALKIRKDNPSFLSDSPKGNLEKYQNHTQQCSSLYVWLTFSKEIKYVLLRSIKRYNTATANRPLDKFKYKYSFLYSHYSNHTIKEPSGSMRFTCVKHVILVSTMLAWIVEPRKRKSLN